MTNNSDTYCTACALTSLIHPIQRINFWLIIMLNFTILGCKQPKSVNTDSSIAPKEKRELDSIGIVFGHLAVANPDSAEQIALQSLQHLNQRKLLPQLFDQHIVLAEFYQYNKPDYDKAIGHITEAIALIQRSPGLLIVNPYIFIDMGNLFNKMDFKEQAVEQYQYAWQMAKKSRIEHARVLALHNMALVNQADQQYDSAEYYLNKASVLFYDHFDLMNGINSVYRADLANRQNNADKAEHWANEALSTLKNHETQRLAFNPSPVAPLYAAITEFQARAWMVLCEASAAHGHLLKAAIFQSQALKLVQKAESPNLTAEYWQCMARNAIRCQASQLQIRQAIDSALSCTRLLNDSRLLNKRQEELLTMLSTYANYQQQAESLEERFTINNPPHLTSQAAIRLSSVSLLQGINQLKQSNQQAEQIIKLHKVVMWLLAIVAFMAGFFLVLMLLKNNQLRIAYATLAEKVKAELNQNTKNINTDENGNGNDPWLPRLTRVMEERKPYLDKTINLNKLALELGTNQTYLSKLINQRYQLNFNEFINKHRVEETCRLIVEGHLHQKSLDQLAEQCGFNSKSTFYAAFKQFTGLTPAQFAKTITTTKPPR